MHPTRNNTRGRLRHKPCLLLIYFLSLSLLSVFYQHSGTSPEAQHFKSAPSDNNYPDAKLVQNPELKSNLTHEQRLPPSPPFQNRNFKSPSTRMSPFLHSSGYYPSGGALPFDDADALYSPSSWKHVDNASCILQQENTPQEWQYRAPFAILIGSMKAGTHAIIESLWEHPSVVPTGNWELHFFDSQYAIRSEKGIHCGPSQINYAKAVEKSVAAANVSVEELFGKHRQMVMVESSPRYIINSDRIPELILCIAPWAKLLAILRHPVDRVESHYRFLDEARQKSDLPMVDWQVWIGDDVRLLNEAGVLNATTKAEELLAWKKYQRRPNSHYIVGRGLYVIQLEHYFSALERAGRPRTDLYVMQSERFRVQRQEGYDDLLQFLGLSPWTLSNVSKLTHQTKSASSKAMPESIRHQLEALYRPYNERLYRLLGWDSVWD